jgi:hypothetical protein
MSWCGDRRRGSPAARRRTALSLRAPDRALPWRRTSCHEAPAAEGFLAWFRTRTPEKTDRLLEGFCPEPRPEEQVAVNSKGRLLLLRLADIDWLEATDNCVALHVGTETLPLKETLSTVMAKLPPGRFLRISPTALVNVEQIKDLRPMCRSEWRVLLRNGTRLTLTRGYGEHLRQAGWFLTGPAKSLVRSRLRAGRPTDRMR